MKNPANYTFFNKYSKIIWYSLFIVSNHLEQLIIEINKRIILIFIGLTFLLISCNEKVTEIHEDPYNATVLGRGMDCGNAFLIQFEDNVTGLPYNTHDNIFYEINLPEIYKIPGKKIKVEYREPLDNETMICTAMGPAYPQLFITKVD